MTWFLSISNMPRASQNRMFCDPTRLAAFALRLGWTSTTRPGCSRQLLSIPAPCLYLPASPFQNLQDGFRHRSLGGRHTLPS